MSGHGLPSSFYVVMQAGHTTNHGHSSFLAGGAHGDASSGPGPLRFRLCRACVGLLLQVAAFWH